MTTSQVEVVPGSHLVATTSGVIVVVAHRESSSLTASSAAAQAWQQLNDLIVAATEQEPDRPGRMIAKAATRWIVNTDDEIEFGILSPADNGLAVFLHGGVTAIVTGPNGEQELFRGSDAAFTVDRIAAASIVAGLFVDDEDGDDPELPDEPGISSLVEGVAPGSGAILWFGDLEMGSTAPRQSPPPKVARKQAPKAPPAEQKKPSVLRKLFPAPTDDLPATAMMKAVDLDDLDDEDDYDDEPQPQPISPPKPLPEPDPLLAPTALSKRPEPLLKPPAMSARIDLLDEPIAPRQPLPGGDGPAPGQRDRKNETTEKGVIGTRVRGFKCARQHLNDPRVAFCRVCGLRMDQLTGILSEDLRPPLGLLVVDDGTTFVLDNDCVLGRDPENSDAARRGLTPIRLQDSSGGMSRAHAEFRLIEWDVAVVDRGSTNGTHVRPPGALEWTRLAPGQPYTLAPGAEVMVGGRTVTFDSPHAHL